MKRERTMSHSVIITLLAFTFALASNSASAQISVRSANPNSTIQGTTNLSVTVSGSGFKKGASAEWFISGTTNTGGVTVNSTAFVNSTTLTANITVSTTAYVGGFDVQVRNTDGRTGKGIELFSVQTNSGQCADTPLMLIVAPQTPGQGGVSGDGLSIYNNPNDPAFNGGTQYQDGVGGTYAEFQICNGTNDFVLNLRSTKAPVRFLNLDFSVQLAAADAADGAVDLTGQQIHQQGEQINEMGDSALYTNGQFTTCSGFMLNALSRTVTGGNMWFKPTTIYDPIVPNCNGGSGPDLANQPINTSPVLVQQIDACTWTVSPTLDSTGTWYRAGVAETVQVTRKTSTSVAGGQYHMPLSYKIQMLNCTP
jgi:hypothetical protein